jgi:hypothetical protein
MKHTIKTLLVETACRIPASKPVVAFFFRLLKLKEV